MYNIGLEGHLRSWTPYSNQEFSLLLAPMPPWLSKLPRAFKHLIINRLYCFTGGIPGHLIAISNLVEEKESSTPLERVSQLDSLIKEWGRRRAEYVSEKNTQYLLAVQNPATRKDIANSILDILIDKRSSSPILPLQYILIISHPFISFHSLPFSLP